MSLMSGSAGHVCHILGLLPALPLCTNYCCNQNVRFGRQKK